MGQRFKSVSRQMISHIEKFMVSDSKFLTYFLPKRFKGEDTMFVTTMSFNKKSLEFVTSSFNIMGTEQSIYFLNSLENKFCVYEDTPFFVYQEFSFPINKLDSSKENILLQKDYSKLEKKKYILSHVNEKDKKLVTDGNYLIKSRLLNLTKGGFVSSFFNSPAYISRSSLFFKFSKKKSYKSWFSLNLEYYGFLSYFSLVYLKRNPFSQSIQQGIFSRRIKFYYLKNEGIKYFFLLKKPKIF